MASAVKFSDWYRQAWSGFSRWWIPLCAVAGLLMLVQLTPQLLLQDDPRAVNLKKEAKLLLAAAQKRDQRRVQFRMRRVQARLGEVAARVIEILIWVGPMVLAIGVLLVIMGMGAASKEGVNLKRDSARTGRRGLSVVLTQALGSVLTILPISLCLVSIIVIGRVFKPEPSTMVFITIGLGLLAILSIPLCMGLYLAFFFAPQLSVDESLNPFRSLRRSIQLIKLAPGPCALLVFCNGSLQSLASLTIIGLIPATAFANTARGAAYYSLLEEEARREGRAVAVSVAPREEPAEPEEAPEATEAEAADEAASPDQEK